jgi:hypothetical protein
MLSKICAGPGSFATGSPLSVHINRVMLNMTQTRVQGLPRYLDLPYILIAKKT